MFFYVMSTAEELKLDIGDVVRRGYPRNKISNVSLRPGRDIIFVGSPPDLVGTGALVEVIGRYDSGKVRVKYLEDQDSNGRSWIEAGHEVDVSSRYDGFGMDVIRKSTVDAIRKGSEYF